MVVWRVLWTKSRCLWTAADVAHSTPCIHDPFDWMSGRVHIRVAEW
jgi:hypothetical protein